MPGTRGWKVPNRRSRTWVTDLGDDRARASKDLNRRLESAGIDRAGKALAAERGLQLRPLPRCYSAASIEGQLKAVWRQLADDCRRRLATSKGMSHFLMRCVPIW